MRCVQGPAEQQQAARRNPAAGNPYGDTRPLLPQRNDQRSEQRHHHEHRERESQSA